MVSAATVGEIRAGIEITGEQDVAKAEGPEARLDQVLASYGVLPMVAPAFREWALLTTGGHTPNEATRFPASLSCPV